MMKTNKISIDFHGVINKAPDFFKSLTDYAVTQGCKIYIVSGGPREYISQYLAEHQIKYDELWCIFDYFDAKQKIAVATDGSFHIDDEKWNAAKGEYCAREKISWHIDDSLIYGRYFSTPYVRFESSTALLYYGQQSISIHRALPDIWLKLKAWSC